ncbi:MAG: DNA-directed RNA polymerase subunit omega [Tissierellales bacterium]|jgi:DNA-directed RNA polymerase subunit omega|nr:DNA-directed RNA polymerase subunit omega [Tissierellales bacterium]
MYNPPIDELLEKVGNRYSLSMIISKRARQIIDGSETIVEKKTEKIIDLAIDELDQDMLSYRRMTEEEIELANRMKKDEELSEEITELLGEYK